MNLVCSKNRKKVVVSGFSEQGENDTGWGRRAGQRPSVGPFRS